MKLISLRSNFNLFGKMKVFLLLFSFFILNYAAAEETICSWQSSLTNLKLVSSYTNLSSSKECYSAIYPMFLELRSDGDKTSFNGVITLLTKSGGMLAECSVQTKKDINTLEADVYLTVGMGRMTGERLVYSEELLNNILTNWQDDIAKSLKFKCSN